MDLSDIATMGQAAGALARATRDPPEVLRFEGVGLSYDDRPVLQNLSFSIRRGETVALLGPSGCGKTTLLNIVAGFLQPSEGVALCDNREIAGPGPDRGVVFQSYALFDWMTVEDNIAFSLRCAGRARSEQREVARRMAALVGLAGFERAYPYQLSGGMRQRCGLARVLAANPSVMLMDEPFAAVDVQTKGGLGAFEHFDVHLPAPRDRAENRLHPEFLAVRERVYRAMRGQGH
jgi:ABC-type nitrate/sulfonate/bicarbonate transport system ATPase subunit